MFVDAGLFKEKTYAHYSSILQLANYSRWCSMNLRDRHYLLFRHTSVLECIDCMLVFHQKILSCVASIWEAQ